MRTLAPAALATASLVALLAPPPLPADERVVEPVVVRVSTEPGGQAYSYVVVHGRDGEPLLLDSVLAERGYLGVSLLELTPELRQHFGAPAGAGVMISAVEPDSPGALAGLRAGDIVTALDDVAVDSAANVIQLVSGGRNGQLLEIDLVRDGVGDSAQATLSTQRRKQVDLGGLLRGPAAERHRHELELRRRAAPTVELDPESMGRALSRMREHFESPEWRERLKREGGDREGIEQRIRELEKRLAELERQLAERPE